MKKVILSLIMITGSIFILQAKDTSKTAEVFKAYAEYKIGYFQQSIGYDQSQADQLIILETQFLLDVQKAETCCLCNSNKKIEKLKEKKYKQIEKILPRDMFVKYKAVDSKKIKMRPHWAE